MSMAVPWSTGVRRFGKPTLTFAPLIDRHFPVYGSTLEASNLTNIVPHLATVRRSYGPLRQNTPQLRHSCVRCNLKQCAALRNAFQGSAITFGRQKTSDVALLHWMAGLLLMVICVSFPPYR
jgi:hypothetical protein